jgi:hypothetical protein
MRPFLSFVFGLVVAVTVATAADARHRRHHGHYLLGLPGLSDADFRHAARSHARSRLGLAALVPTDWRSAPRDPSSQGSRFVSPTGDAWLKFYAVPADQEAVDQYWKMITFVDGEDLRSLRRDRAWVEVAGFRGGRMYFRKAVLACGEREWRHIEYDYPVESQRAFGSQIDRISRAFDRAFVEFCGETVGAQH